MSSVQIDSTVSIDFTDAEMDGRLVSGCKDSVRVLTLSWEVDVSEFALLVYVTLHQGALVSVTTRVHVVVKNIRLYYNIYAAENIGKYLN